jgi:alpha-L-fucosidase
MEKTKILIVVAFLSLIVTQSRAQIDKNGVINTTDISTDKQEMMNWFRESKYAMFIHWGLFSQAANLWKGQTNYGISEWLMNRKQIPVAEYETLAQKFNPVKFNAKEWVQLAKDAGMKYIVITAKHHDGFAMYKSSNPYNIVDATPFKRDPIKELAEACKEGGLKLGFYYSQFQDWHEINSWDPTLKGRSFDDYFRNKCLVQVKELLSNYGPVSLIWFDTPGSMTKDQSLALVQLMKTLQPKALINSRIGNGVGDYSSRGDQEIPPKNIPGLWEAVNTTNDTWAAAWYDENWKSPSQIVRDLISVVARGGNYMLNLGPLADGTMPATISGFLRTSGEWVNKYGYAIYGTSPSPWQRAFSWGDCTLKGNKLYFFVFKWLPGGELNVFGLKNKIKSASIAGEKLENIEFEKDKNGWTTFHLPLRNKQQLIELIEVEIEGKPDVNAELSVDDASETVLGADFALVKNCRIMAASWMEKHGDWKHAQNITGWESDKSQASWVINVKKPGLYFIDFEYNAFLGSTGNEWDIFAEDSSRLRFYSLETTGAEKPEGARYRFRTVRAGTITFAKAGRQTLTVKAASKPKGDGIQLQSLHIVPVE